MVRSLCCVTECPVLVVMGYWLLVVLDHITTLIWLAASPQQLIEYDALTSLLFVKGGSTIWITMLGLYVCIPRPHPPQLYDNDDNDNDGVPVFWRCLLVFFMLVWGIGVAAIGVMMCTACWYTPSMKETGVTVGILSVASILVCGALVACSADVVLSRTIQAAYKKMRAEERASTLTEY